MNAVLWRKHLAYVLTGVGLVALTVTSGMARKQDSQQTGDPVADAARRAREQKKKEVAKPKKVYTDDDMNHAVPDTSSTSTDKSGDAGKDATAKNGTDQNAAGGPETDKDREAKWRKRFKEAYGKVAQAEKELDILQREDNKAQVQYYSDPQKAMQEQYSRKDINEKNSKIAAKKQEIAQLKQQVSDLEEQLRKDGGDPGWAAP
jgi:hypothetical protein